MIFLLRGSNHFGIAGHYAKKALGNITFLREISGTDIYILNVHFSNSTCTFRGENVLDIFARK